MAVCGGPESGKVTVTALITREKFGMPSNTGGRPAPN